MALLNNDLLVIQRVESGQHYKITVDDLEKYIETSSSVTFKGKIDLTSAPTGDALTPNNGDMYVNDTEGTAAAGWTGLAAGTAVSSGDRVIWDSSPGEWIHFTSTGEPGGAVDTITGQTPITVDSNNVSNPIIAILDATTPGQKGAVTIASDGDVTNGTAGKVVTANQLKATNDSISAGGNGTVTNVTGTAPIEVSNNTSTPVVSIQANAFAPYDFGSLNPV